MKSGVLASLFWISLASAAAIAPKAAPVVPEIAAFPNPDISARATTEEEDQLSGRTCPQSKLRYAMNDH